MKELLGQFSYVLIDQGMAKPVWAVRVWKESPGKVGSEGTFHIWRSFRKSGVTEDGERVNGRAQLKRMQEKPHSVWCLGEAAGRTG